MKYVEPNWKKEFPAVATAIRWSEESFASPAPCGDGWQALLGGRDGLTADILIRDIKRGIVSVLARECFAHIAFGDGQMDPTARQRLKALAQMDHPDYRRYIAAKLAEHNFAKGGA